MKWEEKLFGHIENTADDYIDIKDFLIGKVISPDPLEIDAGGLPLYENNLHINPSVLENTRGFSQLTGTIGDSSQTITNGSITFTSEINEGDYVVLRVLNDTTYFLLCKITGV